MSRSLTLSVLSLSLFVAGCKDCGGKIIDVPKTCNDNGLNIAGLQANGPDTCNADNPCGDHYTCRNIRDENIACCVFADRTCETEADCCPGQTCSADQSCFDRSDDCTTDASCGAAGDRYCAEYTDQYGTTKRCRHRSCEDGCAAGHSCFNGECVAKPPCDGKCGEGEGCVTAINRCQKYATPTGREASACPMTCNAGFLATFQDPMNIWDTCDLPAVRCICAELPSLTSNDLGRFSAITSQPGTAMYISHYDGQYGDLVVSRYAANGTHEASEWVDGVPAGTATYSPSGARGGIEAPGDDVGRYTSITTAGGRVYVSYYDVTGGNLKVAIRAASGGWTKYAVDSAGDVGLYTSIATDADGKPAIAYFQKGGDATFDASACPVAPTGPLKYVTALKLAKASSANPAGPADWTIKVVSCSERPPPPCDDCQGQCVTIGDAPVCATAATGCAPACGSGNTCVDVEGEPTCRPRFTPPNLQDIPQGVGVFASLAFKGTDALIAYQYRARAGEGPVRGALYAVQVAASGSAGPPVLLDGNGDTGYFPDLKVDAAGNIGVGYHDFTSRQFKFYFSPTLQGGLTPEVIDRGISATTPGDQGWVGTDSAILFTPNGLAYAVYQDATRGDLKFARREGGTWAVRSNLRSEGSVGYFADAVVEGGKIYASHARIKAKLVSGQPVLDNVLLLDSVNAD